MGDDDGSILGGTIQKRKGGGRVSSSFSVHAKNIIS